MADTLTFPDEGLDRICELVVGKSSQETIRIALFVNDVTVASTSVVADFTQMSTHGITYKDLAGASWGAAAVASGQAVSTYADQTFTATATDDGTATSVYGIIAYTATSSKLLWVIKYDTAKTIQYENDAITYSPSFKFNQKA